MALRSCDQTHPRGIHQVCAHLTWGGQGAHVWKEMRPELHVNTGKGVPYTGLQDKDTTRSDEKVTGKEGRAFQSPHTTPHLGQDAPNSLQKSMGNF